MTTNPVLTRQLVAAGYSHREVAGMTRDGQLLRLRRGAYAQIGALEGSGGGAGFEETEQHRLLVAATLPLVSADAVVSHRSAAALHGLPTFSGLDQVAVTRTSGSGKRRGYVHLHVAPLEADEVEIRDGVAVTTLARTVVDLARHLPYAEAVAVGDAALRQGVAADELAALLQRSTGRPGVAAARRVVGFLDARSESVGESFSRVTLHQLGLAPSSLQFDVLDPLGRVVARADFCWEEERTLGEFDGRAKYGRLLRPGQSPEDALWAEKQREDLLRDLGWQVVRWIWADLQREQLLAERIRRAWRRGSR